MGIQKDLQGLCVLCVSMVAPLAAHFGRGRSAQTGKGRENKPSNQPGAERADPLVESLTMRLLLALLLSLIATPAVAGRPVPRLDGELIIGLKAGVVTAASIGEAADAATRTRLVRVAPGEEATAMARLARDPAVAFVERNRLLPPAEMPDDPVVGYHVTTVGLPEAWDLAHGDPSITIAILDSGIDATHPDLAGQLVPGWNFWDDDADTHDVFGHGTEVAGVASATTDNGTGVAGAAWGCTLMPVRVTNIDGYASLFSILKAVTWAVDNGARVINLSFEGIHSSTALGSAFAYARGHGCLVVAAAGNGGVYDPTADQPDVVSVAATDPADHHPSWASYGPYVDLAAPGVAIHTTARGGGTAAVSGTSFASPLVAGVAALLLSAAPDLTPSELEGLLESTAVDLGAAGRDDDFGAGRLDAAAALAAALPPPDTIPPTLALTAPTAGATVAGTVTVRAAAGDAGGIARVDLYIDGHRHATAAAPPYTFAWETTAAANGAHTLSLWAEDAAGNAASTSPITVTVDNPAVPEITALSTGHALPKHRLTLTGTAFDAGTTVTIGRKPAPVIARTATTLTVKVPRLAKYTAQPVVVTTSGAASAAATLAIH